MILIKRTDVWSLFIWYLVNSEYCLRDWSSRVDDAFIGSRPVHGVHLSLDSVWLDDNRHHHDCRLCNWMKWKQRKKSHIYSNLFVLMLLCWNEKWTEDEAIKSKCSNKPKDRLLFQIAILLKSITFFCGFGFYAQNKAKTKQFWLKKRHKAELFRTFISCLANSCPL